MFIRSVGNKILIPAMLLSALIIAINTCTIYVRVKNSMHEQGLTFVESVRLAIENSYIARQTAENILDKEMAAQATLLSLIVAKQTNYEELVQLAQKSGIDEFWVSDNTGKVILTNTSPNIDFDYAQDPSGQAFEFMDLIHGKRNVIAQSAQPRTLDKQVFKYVGTTGWDMPRIVQVGRLGKVLTDLDAQIGVENTLKSMINNMNEHVLLALVLDANNNVVASSHAEMSNNSDLLGKLPQGIEEEKGIKFAPYTYANKQSTIYYAPLSNGNTLVLILSNGLLTTIKSTAITMSLIGFVLMCIMLGITIKKQTNRIRVLNARLSEIAKGEGDLVTRLEVSGSDDLNTLSTSFNNMLESIRRLVMRIKNVSDQVIASSVALNKSTNTAQQLNSQMSDLVHNLQNICSNQLASAQESSNAVQEIAVGLEQIANNANTVSELAVRANEYTEAGKQTIINASNKMSALNTSIVQSSEVVHALSIKSQQIGQVVELIASISAQIHLLSLNAAIEASRAGEHGRGFAVVASEVRKLAEQAKMCTDQISAIIQNVQQHVQSVVHYNDACMELAEQNQEAVQKANEYFVNIEHAVKQTTSQIQEISAAIQQISASSDEVKNMVIQLLHLVETTSSMCDSVNEQSAKQLISMNEIAQIANQLQQVSAVLHEEVSKFKVS